MELQIFSVFDKKTTVYGKPFFAHNSGHALRLIQDEVDNKDSQLSKYSEDFQLCAIGSFDDRNGSIDPSDVNVVIEIVELSKKE
jgi:hypothetical protein